MGANDAKTKTGVVTIGTNSQKGANLTVKDADEETALTAPASSNVTDTIPTSTTIAAGTSAWGISGGKLTSINAMPKSTETALEVYKWTSSEADGPTGDKDINMTYHFSTSAGQQAGVYSDVITYTVAINN